MFRRPTWRVLVCGVSGSIMRRTLLGRIAPVDSLGDNSMPTPSTPVLNRLRGEGEGCASSTSIRSDQATSIGSTADSLADAPSSPPPSPPSCTVEPLGAPETAAEVPVSVPGLPPGIAVSASGGIDHERLDRLDRFSRLDCLDRLDRLDHLDRLDALDRADACAARLAASQKIVL